MAGSGREGEAVDDGEASVSQDVVEVGGAGVVVESAFQDDCHRAVDYVVVVDLVDDFDILRGGRCCEVRVVPEVFGVVVDQDRAVVVRDGDPEFFDGGDVVIGVDASGQATASALDAERGAAGDDHLDGGGVNKEFELFRQFSMF